MTSPTLPHSPAADRNKAPILACLERLFPAEGLALEIASGTGQHVTWFAAALPGWRWQPTDADAQLLPVIAARAAEAGTANVLPPLQLDVASATWPLGARRFDAIYCANLLHIAPWSTCAALMAGAARHLAPGGRLVTYGPYFEADVPAAAGNRDFDASLRARDPAWGVRQLADVDAQARLAGLVRAVRQQMPANNLLLVYRPAADAG